MSFLYGAAGTTSLSGVAGGGMSSPWSASGSVGSFALIGLLLTFAGLAFKVAAVPLHFYLADVYEGAASPVAGMLGFVPKLAGFLALAKIFAACDWSPPVEVYWTVWVVAAATMTTGNVLALLQSNVKRVLAYSSIAHTGYMLIALFVGPVAGQGALSDGVAALLFYMAVYGAMNLGAFAVLAAFRVGDREAETWDDLAGLSVRAPLVALALAICAFSLMGIPPTAGFIGKIFIFSSAFSLPADHVFRGPLVVLAVIGVVNSAIGAAYYLRMAATPYLRAEVEKTVPTGGVPLRWGLALCAIPMLVLFVWPVGLADQARRATVALKHTAGIQHINLAAREAENDPSRQASTSVSSSASLPNEPEAR